MKVQDDPEFKKIISELGEEPVEEGEEEEFSFNPFGGPSPKPLSLEEGKRIIEIYNKTHVFYPGDLVEWKPGLKICKIPKYREPMMVLKILSDPITDTQRDSGSPYFGERYDLVGMFKDSDGDVLFYYYDSRRFMPFQGGEKGGA